MRSSAVESRSGPPPGGPSTITGITYQMLWCLLRAVQMHVCAVTVDDTRGMTHAVLRLEPRNGGDVQEVGEVTRRIVQLKTRSSGGPWSLREMVTDVLPDLYRAVDLNERHSSYSFITEGEMGQWKDVYEFFHSLRHRDPTYNLLDVLSNEKLLRFTHRQTTRHNPSDKRIQLFQSGTPYTERALFTEIVQYLRETKAIPQDESEEQTQRKAWSLLSRFCFIGGQSLTHLRAEIDSLLLALVDYPEQVDEKRRALLQWLAEHAAQGDVIVKGDDLLQQHGLQVTPLTAWAALRAASQRLLRRRLELCQYQSHHDVRLATTAQLAQEWSTGPPLLAFTGDSGDGKSWSLYSLGLHLTSGPEVVALLEATGDATKDLQQAADLVWQEMKGNGGSQPLSRIAAQRQHVVHPHAKSWCVVLMDNVQDTKEAERLAKEPVEDWGVRLVITGPPDVVAVFTQAAGERARCMSVPPFSSSERDRYLESRLGEHWVAVPSDVRDTLRRPLLAHIYCDEVADPDGWQPQNEYALYARMWQRLEVGSHAPSPYDAPRFAQLARTVLDDVPYPWPAARLAQLEIPPDMLQRLTRSGWLRPTSHNRFEVPHDRLLNYAVAHALFDAFQLQPLDMTSLSTPLRELLTTYKSYSGRRLDYVPLDLFALLLALGDDSGAVCSEILATLDDLPEEHREGLYTELLPTLDASILPVLFTRFTATIAKHDGWYQQPILTAIATFDTPEVRRYALQLLNDEDPGQQRAALRLLARRPEAAALDRLWQVHCAMQDDPVRYDGAEPWGWLLYEESFAALRACLQEDTGWLERAIRTAPLGQAHVSDLAYLVADLRDGAPVWYRCKADLIAKVPNEKLRAIVTNIGRYHDHQEADRLIPLMVRKDDLVGPAALRALCRLDPDRAIEQLVRLPEAEMYMTRSWYLPYLLEVRREQVNRTLHEHLRRAADPWNVAEVYQGNENDMAPETLALLLEALERRLDTVCHNLPSQPDRVPVMWRLLNLLAAVYRDDLLRCFKRYESSTLACKLADFLLAISPAQGAGMAHPEREPGLAVLQKIGGNAYGHVLNAWLAYGHHFDCLDAIKAAHHSADAETVQQLARIATQSDLSGASSYASWCATNALAARGETRHLIAAVLHLGLRTAPDLNDLVKAPRPFDDAAVASALQLLTQDDSSEAERIGAVLAIGIAGRDDHLQTIQILMERASPESDLALACLATFGALADDSERTLRLFARQLQHGQHTATAYHGLLDIGTPATLRRALEHIQQRYDDTVAVALAQREPTRQAALELIAHALHAMPAPELDEALDRVLARLDSTSLSQILTAEKVRERLRDCALAVESNMWHIGSKFRAILGLATFDLATAFLATKKALADPKAHDRTWYPYLLVQLDESRAMNVLIQQCIREQSTMVQRAISRALSRTTMDIEILQLLGSPRSAERLAGCHLCAYRECEEPIRQQLYELLQDIDEDVAQAALHALRERTRAQEATALVQTLTSTQNRAQQWLLLEALLNIADVGDEGRRYPLWAQEIGTFITVDMAIYLRDELLKRRTKIKEQLESTDRQRRR